MIIRCWEPAASRSPSQKHVPWGGTSTTISEAALPIVRDVRGVRAVQVYFHRNHMVSDAALNIIGDVRGVVAVQECFPRSHMGSEASLPIVGDEGGVWCGTGVLPAQLLGL
jgi:hypothetical protein